MEPKCRGIYFRSQGKYFLSTQLIKYAYMCHFYANPLSFLLALSSIDLESVHEYLTSTHLNAIRSLPSIRKYVEEKLAENDTEEVKSILLDDSYFISLLPQFVDLLETKAQEVREALVVLAKLSERSVKTKRGLQGLYLDSLMGKITSETPFVRELLQLQR
jgi:origin recognition complex subunit 3